jgi:hypothetical protein
MRQKPQGADWSDEGAPRSSRPSTSGRHRTVMAAVVRQQSGKLPVVPQPLARGRRRLAGPDPTSAPPSRDTARTAADPADAWQAGDAAWSDALEDDDLDDDPWSGSGAHTRVIFDRDEGQVPALLPSITLPQRSVRAQGAALAHFGRTAVAVSRAIARRPPASARSTLIPGDSTKKIAVVIPRGRSSQLPVRTRPVAFIIACVSLLVAVTAAGVTTHTELAGNLGNSFWSAASGVRILPTPIGGYWDPPIDSSAPPAPSYTDAGHYVAKYGFDWPGSPAQISSAERARLQVMLPFALAATARWDARFGDRLEPQMLLFWTHAEGITAHVSFSNCNNEYPPAGYSYFSYIANCDTPSFWQLGYGNQFGVIDILKTAFRDMRGNPNDPRAVQRVGQAVLDWDRRQGTTPVCGGYSCTFPAMTIDQIMAGVSLNHPTTNDWWASVLSRDPAINCYMLARALIWFNHNATRGWVGCYYAEPCWSLESNRLSDILVAWNSLRKAAGV